jgi:hypothetical protein
MAGLGYGEVSSAAPGSSAKSGGGGLLGNVLGAPLHFTEHLLSDVGDAAIGFVPGTYHLITDPKDALPAIAKGIAADWAPLFTGHPGEWAKNFYEHPLGPILDVAALFTGGATAAGKGASILSKAEYAGVTARGAARAGVKNTAERVIVEGGSKPGQFAKRMAEPSRVDRLAAYYREGSRTLTKHDRVGASGRIRVGDEARFDIPYQTGKTVAQKFRAEQLDKLMQNFATRGGTLGAIPQMSYEMSAAARLGGSVGALRWQMQMLDKYLDKVYDPATGQVKHHGMVKIANDWYDRLVAHAVESNRFVEVGGKWNDVSYSPVATRSSITRSRKHYRKGGVVEKGRGFGTGGKEHALNDMKHLGHRMTNPKETRIFTGEELIAKWGADAGKVDPAKRYHVLADRHTARNSGVDAARSTNFLMQKFYRGTSIWKTIILGYSPRFFVNNFIGNGLMFSMNYMGSGSLFGLRQYMRYKHGLKGYKMADSDMAKAIREMGPQNWLQQHFANQLGQSLHETSLAEKGARGTLFENPGLHPTGRLERGAKHMFGWAGSKAEQNYRIAAIMIEVRADERVTRAMKRLHKKDPKLSRDELFDRAATEVLAKNPDLVRTVNQNVQDVMGNYASLIGPERALKTISPFYAWQRHIVRNSVHMALDKPIRTALLTDIGEQGSEWVTKEFGGVIPHFGQGLLPLGGNKPNGGILRRPVLSTASFNPWAQVGELARTGEATLGLASGGDVPTLGETYGSLLNPFLTAGVGALAQKNLFTGTPQDARTSLLSPVTGLPQFQLGKSLIAPDQYSGPTLYKKSPEQTFLGLLGVTKKDLYEAKLRQLGLAELKGG